MMQISEESTLTRLLGVGAVLLSVYLVAGAIYRLYFSPIAKFPGPKLAALTLWYEFYFDVILRGQFTFHIRELHKKYGPIIRINPYELHIDDPEFYDELYGGPGKKRDKFAWSAAMFGNGGSMLSTVSHEHHRVRRAPLNSFFSKQSVYSLEPLLRSAVATLCSRFEEFRTTKEPIVLDVAFSALTTDIITEYSFAKSTRYLYKPNFAPEWKNLTMMISEFSLLNKQFPFVFPMLMKAPDWLAKKIDPNTSAQIEYRQSLEDQIIPIMDGKNDAYKTAKQPTIFHELLESDLQPSEKTLERLIDEAQTIIAAGSMTTAHFLAVTSYHILANPSVLSELQAELQEAQKQRPEAAAVAAAAVGSAADLAIPPLRQLEQLPYLSAVVKEGFRVSFGVTSRLTRISPDAPLVYKDHYIPAGTPVGMTSILMHENAALFPEPRAFRPRRWLAPGAQRLEKYLVNFSKGTRACLGLNLAKAEIYLALAAVYGGRFGVELFETGRADADVAHDFFNPSGPLNSKGVRVVLS